MVVVSDRGKIMFPRLDQKLQQESPAPLRGYKVEEIEVKTGAGWILLLALLE